MAKGGAGFGAGKGTGRDSGFGKGGRDQKGGFRRSLRRSDNPDVIYGRDFEGEMGEVTVHGQVLSVEERDIRGERTILMVSLTDFTDTIRFKLFVSNEDKDSITEHVKKGVFLKVRGMTVLDPFDKELGIGSITGIKKSSDFRVKREDRSETKRVELHCHTKMSDMDGVSDVASIMKQAKAFGHKALAITDHGVVQAFTEASHALAKGDSFKLIYGVEAYLVDDMKEIVTNSRGRSRRGKQVGSERETTG